MARLQILELPTEHHGDDMVTPFLLVIDQVDDDTAAEIARWPDNISSRTGARHVLCFSETVEIPANEAGGHAEPLLRVGGFAASEAPERAGTREIVYAHERTRLDLCSALLVSGGTTWRKLIEHATERQRELAGLYKERDSLAGRLERVRSLSEQPKVVDASIKDPQTYRHAYSVAISNAKFVARGDDEKGSGL